MDDVCILHLTDIHAGPGKLDDEDDKASIPNAYRTSQLGRLVEYLEALPRKPDFVVVSGDVTIKGNRQGMEDFRTWLFTNIETNNLPSPDRIIIVPGNHDVTRRNRKDIPDGVQFRHFFEVFAKIFPHAYLPAADPPLVVTEPKFASDSTVLIGGITTGVERGETKLLASYPFVLDLENDVLIFAFNSALGCGLPLEPDKRILDAFDLAVRIHEADANTRPQFEAARDAYLDSLVADAGWIRDEQINYFGKLMSRLRRSLGRRFDRITKIAVLHHHVSHLWKQQLELKTFEAVIDAAQLKQSLIENGFDFVLHGHKHTNHVGIDGSLIPVSDKARFDPLCIVSGGTVGGYPRLNDYQSFKLLFLSGAKGPRSRAIIHEVPIRLAGNPATALTDETKIYHAPSSRKFPRLHDMGQLKATIEEYLIKKCAPELATPTGDTANQVKLGPGNRMLFAPSLRYECYQFHEEQNRRTYYEIILATDKIGFTKFARLHWLMSDALGPQLSQAAEHRVIVLIGNLEDTHYSEATERNEVRRSIKELEKQFSPSLKSNKLEIRSYDISQDEILQLTQTNEITRVAAE